MFTPNWPLSWTNTKQIGDLNSDDVDVDDDDNGGDDDDDGYSNDGAILSNRVMIVVS